MSEKKFLRCFGGVYEHSPWIARGAWRRGIDTRHDTVAALSAALARIVDEAERDQQLALIRAHPDLAGRAAIRHELTADSSAEQASAGIDHCTRDEFARFQWLNEAYKNKFGFPFVMAVKGSNRQAILAAFEARLDNDLEAEFHKAISEIHKIARLRLEQFARTGKRKI